MLPDPCQSCRLTSAGDFSSVPGEREDFHLSGCLIEVVPHHHGSHIQLVDMVSGGLVWPDSGQLTVDS